MSKYAGVAVLSNNNILLARRIEFYKGNIVPYGGYWSVFAGAIEEGESPEDTAERELFEEAKITIENPLVLVDTIDDFSLFATEFDNIIHPELNFEHTEYGWFKIDSLKSFPYQIDEKIVDLILKYKKIV